MIINKLTCMIGGEAGFGIDKAGNILARTCSRGGLHIFGNFEFPSLVRGGHNTFHLRINQNSISSTTNIINILIALNEETYNIHKSDLRASSAVIYDPENFNIPIKKKIKDVLYFPIPTLQLARDHGGNTLFRNIVTLGVVIQLVKYDFKLLTEAISYQFKKKGNEIIKKNIQSAQAGYDYIKNEFKNYKFNFQLKPVKAKKRMIINGNTALALGAIKSGLKFVASYPMTPGTSVFQYVAAQARKYNIIVKHTEDEIAAMNMLIGAGYAGCRSLGSTSGGGFALMTEALGMASIAEVPLVIVNVQRPGPSTGLPTRTGQGDLQFMINASQGDFPFILLAPSNTEECFYTAFEALNLAEQYQCPVGIISDKYLADSLQTLPIFKTKHLKIKRGALITSAQAKKIKKYKRYAFTTSGISKRALPGYENCVHHQTSYEHSEDGDFTEDSIISTKMNEKRFNKLKEALKKLPAPKLIGPKKADFTLICWGSTLGAVEEAAKLLNKTGIKINYLQIKYMNPFHSDEIKKILQKSSVKINIEGNYSGQLAQLIGQKTGILMDYSILKYNGRPIYPHEIVETIQKIKKTPTLKRNVLTYASS